MLRYGPTAHHDRLRQGYGGPPKHAEGGWTRRDEGHDEISLKSSHRAHPPPRAALRLDSPEPWRGRSCHPVHRGDRPSVSPTEPSSGIGPAPQDCPHRRRSTPNVQGHRTIRL